jgi:TolB-like protein
MDKFFAELKRRQMFRVAAAYAVLAWVLLQFANNITPALRLPEWIPTAVVVLLMIGFPVALLFCWIQQLAPGGESKTTTGRLDWVLIGALVVVIGLVSYQQLAPLQTTRTQQGGVDAARTASATRAGTISLAVLPFANLSSDPEQEFFSDGMTEEITSALAKVADLRVVARTSAFEFKGQNRDIKTMGEQLGATHLIEGSVRKAGTRVRITVQLIKADDGTHIWSENYDRELTDIFAIQEDIARTITASLRMPLGLNPGENLVNNRGIDPESYQLYLRARAAQQRGTLTSRTDASRMFEQVVARNPDYAPAWARLCASYALTGNALVGNDIGNENTSVDELRRVAGEFLAKADAAGRRALALDPDLAPAYACSGIVSWARSKPLEADELFLKALALDPNDPPGAYSIRLAIAGRVKEALAMNEQIRLLEPFLPGPAAQSPALLWLNGQNDAAIALAKTLNPGVRATNFARIYASMGRFGEAADALEATDALMEIPPGDPYLDVVRNAARLLRMAPVKLAAEELPRLPQVFDHIYLHVGAPERVLDNFERRTQVGLFAATSLAQIWHPQYAVVRKTERFKAYARAAGLVDYWRVKGWPASCRPTTADDFECD